MHEVQIPAPHSEITAAYFVDDGLQVVVYEGRSGLVYLLDDLAAATWVLCDGVFTINEIVDQLAALSETKDRYSLAENVSIVVQEFRDRRLLDS